MSDRHPVTKTPFGSPAAGPVKVYRMDPRTGGKMEQLRLDPAWPSDLAPEETLPQGPNRDWVAPETLEAR